MFFLLENLYFSTVFPCCSHRLFQLFQVKSSHHSYPWIHTAIWDHHPAVKKQCRLLFFFVEIPQETFPEPVCGESPCLSSWEHCVHVVMWQPWGCSVGWEHWNLVGDPKMGVWTTKWSFCCFLVLLFPSIMPLLNARVPISCQETQGLPPLLP